MPGRPTLPPWHRPDPTAISPTRAAVQAWLDAYVRAWRSYDPDAIADLWTEDCVWAYPFGVRARGRAAITAEWLRSAISTTPAATTRTTNRSRSMATSS